MDDILKNLFGNFHNQGGSRRKRLPQQRKYPVRRATAVSTVREQAVTAFMVSRIRALTASILARAEVTAAKAPMFMQISM